MQFPSEFMIDRESYVQPSDDGSAVDRADDGSPRVRRMWQYTWYAVSFNVVGLTEDDVEALEDFYEENRLVPIEFTNPITGNPMTAFMVKKPDVVDSSARTFAMNVQLTARYA